MASIPSSLLLGIDVGTLLYAIVEQGNPICNDVGKRIVLVAYHLPLPESCNSHYAKTVSLERRETANRHFDDAGTDLQATYSREIVTDGKICDKKSGTLFRAEKESSLTHARAYVRMEPI